MGTIASRGEDAYVRLHMPHWVLKACRVKYSTGRCLWQRDWKGQGAVGCAGVKRAGLSGLQPVGWQASEKVKLTSSEDVLVFVFGVRSVHFHLHFFFVSKELSQFVFLVILLIYIHLEELRVTKRKMKWVHFHKYRNNCTLVVYIYHFLIYKLVFL